MANSHKPTIPHVSPNQVLALLVSGIAVFGIVLCLTFYPQPWHYHEFADQRTLLGLPHFFNVISNAPFLLIGLAGLAVLVRRRGTWPSGLFLDRVECWPYGTLFLGVALTAFGSAYYHLDPTTERLVWDRLPMTIGFMSFFAAMLGEHIDAKVGTWLLGPLLLFGIGSVVQWYTSELHGAGNLWIYAFVQFYPLVTVCILLRFFTSRYTGRHYVWGALGWY